MSVPTVVTLESIMQALEALLTPLLSNGSGFQVVSRDFKAPDQVGDVQLPALYILQGPITNVREGGKPAKQTLSVWLFIYTNPEQATPETGVYASSLLNNALTSVMSIMVDRTFPLKEQTLNGLVSNCWVEGEVIYDSGEIQPPGLAVVPVKILVPAIAI